MYYRDAQQQLSHAKGLYSSPSFKYCRCYIASSTHSLAIVYQLAEAIVINYKNYSRSWGTHFPYFPYRLIKSLELHYPIIQFLNYNKDYACTLIWFSTKFLNTLGIQKGTLMFFFIFHLVKLANYYNHKVWPFNLTSLSTIPQYSRRIFVYTFCLINICLSLSEYWKGITA